MHVHAAFLASAARIQDGLVYVIGGFPDSWTVPSLPATTRLTLVVVFELGADEEPNGLLDLAVELWHDAGGDTVATAHVEYGGVYEPNAGAPKFQSVVIPFDVQLHHVGPHEIHLTTTGVRIASVRFAVRTDASASAHPA